jgi:hypothetical protein
MGCVPVRPLGQDIRRGAQHGVRFRGPARAGVAIAVGAAVLLAGGCTSGVQTQDAPRPESVAQLAVQLTRSVADDDRSAFDALFAAGAPSQVAADSGAPAAAVTATPGRRDLLWANLRQLASVDFEPGPQAGTLRVAWTVGPQDVAPATQLVAGIDCDASGCGVRNLVAVVGEPAPIWVVQPVIVQVDQNVAVISGADAQTAAATATSGVDLATSGVAAATPSADTATPGAADTSSPSPWLGAARTAVQAVSGADLAGLTDPTAGKARLVVEVPATWAAFQAVLGQNGAGFIDTGAFTWVENTGLPGSQASSASARPGSQVSAAVRVVINPSATAGLTASQRAALLAHEAVHVATIGHPVAAGRLWVSEGLAETVGLGLDAGMAAHSAASAAAACTPSGLTPPSDQSFGGDPAGQQTSYAVSWQLITLLRVAPSADQAQQDIVALWDGEPATAVLARLAQTSTAWCAGR